MKGLGIQAREQGKRACLTLPCGELRAQLDWKLRDVGFGENCFLNLRLLLRRGTGKFKFLDLRLGLLFILGREAWNYGIVTLRDSVVI